jgi:hypothetical protein
MEPVLKNVKFKPSFATNENQHQLQLRLINEINPQLVSICSGFTNLSDAKGLNELVNNYLNKTLQGFIYSGI